MTPRYTGDMTPNEEWRPVVGREGAYEVSSLGRVRSLDRWVERSHGHGMRIKGRVLRKVLSDGYYRVGLGQQTYGRIHTLVAEAFLGPRPDRADVRHLNGDPLDNRATNLAYGTRTENLLDAVAHGAHYWANKTHCPSGHPYDATNTRLYQGRRYCRACHAQRASERGRRARLTS